MTEHMMKWVYKKITAALTQCRMVNIIGIILPEDKNVSDKNCKL